MEAEKAISNVGQCRGFQFNTLNLEVTSVFYERLGFIKEYDFHVEPGFQVAWFRDNRFEEDAVDDETSFIGFSWDKSLDVQVNGLANPSEDIMKLVVHVRDMKEAIQCISELTPSCGCWVHDQPTRVQDNLVTAIAIDPNGIRIQLVQVTGPGVHLEEEDIHHNVSQRLLNRQWLVKFGDFYLQQSRPKPLTVLLEKLFSTVVDATNSDGKENEADDDNCSSKTYRDGIQILDREEFPTAMTEFIWLGSQSRYRSPALCVYSRDQRSTYTSLAAIGESNEEVSANTLFAGVLVFVKDFSIMEKMMEIYSNSNSLHGDLGRFESIETNNKGMKLYHYLPRSKLDLKLIVRKWDEWNTAKPPSLTEEAAEKARRSAQMDELRHQARQKMESKQSSEGVV
jgi:hypothetical protein